MHHKSSTYSATQLKISGVSTLNLKGINCSLPHRCLTVLTGPSGSGKSALALRTIYTASMQRLSQHLESSAIKSGRGFTMPRFENAEGLLPAICINDLSDNSIGRTSVGELFGLEELLAEIIALEGNPFCAENLCNLSPPGGAWVKEQVWEAIKGILALEELSEKTPPREPLRPLCVLVGAYFPEKFFSGEFGGTSAEFATGSAQGIGILHLVEKFSRIGFRRFLFGSTLFRHSAEEASLDLCSQLSAKGLAAPDEFSVIVGFFRLNRFDEEEFEDALQQALSLGSSFAIVKIVSWDKHTGELYDHCHMPSKWLAGEGYFCDKCWSSMPLPTAVTCRQMIRGEDKCDGELDIAFREISARTLKQRSFSELSHLMTVPRESDSTEPRTDRSLQFLQALDKRLSVLDSLNLGHLLFSQPLSTLSSGERLRVALACCVLAEPVDTLLILDEPSRVLSPAEMERVADLLNLLVEHGNTVLLVERRRCCLSSAKHVIELGPGSGDAGGRIVYEGPGQILLAEKSGSQLNSTFGETDFIPTDFLRIKLSNTGPRTFSDLSLPLHSFVCVVGPSSSGKTLLLRDVLEAAHSGRRDSREVEGIELLKRVYFLEQEIFTKRLSTQRGSGRFETVASLGRVSELIAKLFSALPQARKSGFLEAHFVLGDPAGACPVCCGRGQRSINVPSLGASIELCEECRGSGLKQQIIEVRYHGQALHEVLLMTVNEARVFFRSQRNILARLDILSSAELGHLKLSTPAANVETGAYVRLKLLPFLVNKGSESATLLLLDQVFFAMSDLEFESLLRHIAEFTRRGGSIVAATHDPRAIIACDYLVVMDGGGEILHIGVTSKCPSGLLPDEDYVEV